MNRTILNKALKTLKDRKTSAERIADANYKVALENRKLELSIVWTRLAFFTAIIYMLFEAVTTKGIKNSIFNHHVTLGEWRSMRV